MSFSLSEYTKIDVGWGFASDSAGGAYRAPPDPVAGFKEAASRQEGRGGKDYGMGKRGREGKRGEMGEERLVVGG